MKRMTLLRGTGFQPVRQAAIAASPWVENPCHNMMVSWFLSVVMFAMATAHAGDWHQWRGPEQTGVSRERNLPESWSPEGENLAWVNDCGGMSSPIVMNGKVYTLTRVGDVPAGEGP